MNSETPEFLYTLLDREFFAGIESRAIGTELLDVVRKHVPGTWSIHVAGFWTQCNPPDTVLPVQGWKIHISARPDRVAETIDRVVPILARRAVSFKFCSDIVSVRMSLNKNWARTQAGKFITVYPTTTADFVAVAKALHEATTDLDGPFVLSDKPYPGSKVVFYRYGEFQGVPTVDAYGNRVSRILAPDGSVVADGRRPGEPSPDWVTDPIVDTAPPRAPGPDGVMLNDRFRITGAIKFSNIGGVYMGTDTRNDERVIVREARPLYTAIPGSTYEAKQILRKEARLLERLTPTGLVPRFVDCFDEWTHCFLVQEQLDADSLWVTAMEAMFNDDARRDDLWRRLMATFRSIATGLVTIHGHGVILRDLTKTNVMFTKAGDVKFIDLEFAFDQWSDDEPVAGWTPGYASQEQMRNERPQPTEDYYALGVLLLEMFTFVAPGYDLNRIGSLRWLRQVLIDLNLPLALLDAVEGLTAPNPNDRWHPDQAVAFLDAIPAPTDNRHVVERGVAPPMRNTPTDELQRTVQRTLEGIVEFTTNHCTVSRMDRLWPVSAEAFSSNPVQLEYGACGPALFLRRVGVNPPDAALDWIVAAVDRARCPAGLMSGLSGVALTLLENGRIDDAKRVLERGNQRDLIHVNTNLYYGASGWGLVNLWFWLRTGEGQYLSAAQDVADRLLEKAVMSAEGASWDTDGFTHLGLGHGQSGTALFLLYLNAVSPDARLLETAVRALDFEVAHGYEGSGMLIWFPNVDANPGQPKSPHMRHGSAGVGTALIRCHAATGEPRFRSAADRCAHAVAGRLTNKIWHDYGLAGFGEFLLDMYQFTNEENYLNSAFYIAEGIVQHRIERPDGIAFLGASLLRLSCDYGNGASGIGVFLHRLLSPMTERLLLPDHVLRETPKTPRLSSQQQLAGAH